MKLSATEKGAWITAAAMLLAALVTSYFAYTSDQNAKLLRLMVTKYAGCGCKITFTPSEIQTVSFLRTGPQKAIERILADPAFPVSIIPEGPASHSTPFSFTLMAPDDKPNGQTHNPMRNIQRADQLDVGKKSVPKSVPDFIKPIKIQSNQLKKGSF